MHAFKKLILLSRSRWMLHGTHRTQRSSTNSPCYSGWTRHAGQSKWMDLFIECRNCLVCLGMQDQIIHTTLMIISVIQLKTLLHSLFVVAVVSVLPRSFSMPLLPLTLPWRCTRSRCCGTCGTSSHVAAPREYGRWKMVVRYDHFSKVLFLFPFY